VALLTSRPHAGRTLCPNLFDRPEDSGFFLLLFLNRTVSEDSKMLLKEGGYLHDIIIEE